MLYKDFLLVYGLYFLSSKSVLRRAEDFNEVQFIVFFPSYR